MVTLAQLWLPILMSAVVVFLASSLLHMVLPLHRTDWAKLPNEDPVMDVLRPIAAGDYMMPHSGGPAGLKDPAFIEKLKRGPMATLTIASGDPQGAFKKALALWFVYALVVSVFAAYVTGRALRPGTEYAEVFRFAATTAFLGYSLALAQHSIWYSRKWSTTIKSMFDGLVYGLLTAGIFGWLWPK